jgi:hypothetical protein
MRSPWPVRILLPGAQALAEGSWLAVVYAALQASSGEFPYVGPLELGALSLAGTAWGRRRRWRSPTAEAVGLPLLALAAGGLAWLLAPDVRLALVDGNLFQALGLHVPGWLGALAFWRGETHRVREEDAIVQDRLMRWAVPGLAVPWFVGYAAASGQVEDDFVAAAFLATVLFIGSAFTALGLARLEAVRLSTGSEWRGNRSWLFMILGMALGLTVLSVFAATFMGIPADSLLSAIVGPLQTLFLLLFIVSAPIFLVAAVIADLLASLLPPAFQLPQVELPSLAPTGPGPNTDLPAIILTIVVGAIFAFDLIALGLLAWVSLRQRWRGNEADPAFEERAIVVPDSAPAQRAPRAASRRRARIAADDATGAYLAALDALDADGRWPRRPQETPAAHLSRARSDGLLSPAFGRLVASYQLARYSPRPLPEREHQRAGRRLQSLLGWLRDGQNP